MVHDELRKLVAELGQDAALNQPALLRKRIAERFNDQLVTEVLVSSVTAEVPKRLREMAAVNLTRTAVVNYAKQISGKTGLIEDVARWAIEAWAYALGLAIVGNKPPPIAEPLQQLLGRLQSQRIQREPPTVAPRETTDALTGTGIAFLAVAATLIIIIIYFVISYFNKPHSTSVQLSAPLYLSPLPESSKEFSK